MGAVWLYVGAVWLLCLLVSMSSNAAFAAWASTVSVRVKPVTIHNASQWEPHLPPVAVAKLVCDSPEVLDWPNFICEVCTVRQVLHRELTGPGDTQLLMLERMWDIRYGLVLFGRDSPFLPE